MTTTSTILFVVFNIVSVSYIYIYFFLSVVSRVRVMFVSFYLSQFSLAEIAYTKRFFVLFLLFFIFQKPVVLCGVCIKS